MLHNLTEDQNYILHHSKIIYCIHFLLENNMGSVQQYMEINEADQQQTDDAAISYTNLNLQL